MEKEQILKADLLDILFEGRNKEYGAYDLRKTYNRRMVKAMSVTALVVLGVLANYLIFGMERHGKSEAPNVKDVNLASVEPKKQEPVVTPPPMPKVEPKKIEMKQFTPPLLTKEEVKPEERPPVQEELENTKIGAINEHGDKDDGVVAPPPSDGGTGVVEAPKKAEDDENTIFTKVEIESEYPGGMAAWARYLNKTLHYPEEAVNNEIQGSVLVQFVVDQEGNVSDVQVVSGPTEGGLREEAIRVIKKSGRWTPAVQNGKHVKSYKRQPVGFKLGSE